jgi:Swt1-like HEPN
LIASRPVTRPSTNARTNLTSEGMGHSVPDPLGPHRAALQQLRWRAEQLLAAIAHRPATQRSPADQVHRELFAGIGGALTSEFLGRRRVGSSVGRAIAASGQAAQRQRELEAARGGTQDLVREARQLVHSVSQTLGPRLTQSLLRLLAQADSAHRPDTSVRRVLEAVGRIEGWQPPSLPSRPTEQSSDALRMLERELRRCIEERLSRLTANWWTERVPEEVRLHAERRMSLRERVWPWLDSGGHRPIEYLDFPDYARIILDPQNWQQAFSPVFVDPDALRVKLRELEPIRNDVAHSRQITAANADRLLLYARELVERVNR